MLWSLLCSDLHQKTFVSEMYGSLLSSVYSSASEVKSAMEGELEISSNNKWSSSSFSLLESNRTKIFPNIINQISHFTLQPLSYVLPLSIGLQVLAALLWQNFKNVPFKLDTLISQSNKPFIWSGYHSAYYWQANTYSISENPAASSPTLNGSMMKCLFLNFVKSNLLFEANVLGDQQIFKFELK